MTKNEQGYYEVKVGGFGAPNSMYRYADNEANETAIRQFRQRAQQEGVRMELGVPKFSETVSWADRIGSIDENRVCAIIRDADLSIEKGGGTLTLECHGPLRQVADVLLGNNDARFCIRAVKSDKETLAKIITWDLLMAEK